MKILKYYQVRTVKAVHKIYPERQSIQTAIWSQRKHMTNQNENSRYEHVTRLRVPLYDVDIGQAVYHGNYYHLFEIARDHFFRDMGFPYRRIMDAERHLSVVEATCRYKKSLRYDDEVDIHTSLMWMRTRSLGMCQKIFRTEEDGRSALCTEVSLNMVCTRFSGGAATLPPDFVKCLRDRTGIAPKS